MRELRNTRGEICAFIDPIRGDGKTCGLAVSWKKGVGGLPDESAWNQAVDSCVSECAEKGAVFIDSRVITASEGVDDMLSAARAELHRNSLAARGFTQGKGRVEYRMDLGEAISALESRGIPRTLAWECVDAANQSDLAAAADLFRRAGEGDPCSRPDDDALGFLKGLLEDPDAAARPERIQIGKRDGAPAAVLALMAFPGDGWSTVYYLGVLPAFRGRGLGREAMLHALRCLKEMGGRTYQDGTGADNAPARALFTLLGRPPFRVMEEWRLRRQVPARIRRNIIL